MNGDILYSPLAFLQQRFMDLPLGETLQDYERWWLEEGIELSAAADRAATPWLKTYDRQGGRVDEIQLPGGYARLRRQGYRAGVVWRAFHDRSLLPAFLLGYVTAFHDPGLYCPYTLSLATALSLDKRGDGALQ